MTAYIYDVALLTSVALICSMLAAWAVDRVWRRRYLAVKRRLNVLTGRPLDLYRRHEPPTTRRDVARNNDIARSKWRTL